MGDVVNLRRARKAKVRAAGEVTAAANRAAFGRTKGEKAGERTDRERAKRILDGVRLEPSSVEGVVHHPIADIAPTR